MRAILTGKEYQEALAAGWNYTYPSLIYASQAQEWAEKIALKGRISAMDKGPMSFDLGLKDGTRLKELAALNPGWLDGKGLALDRKGLQALTRDFDNYFDPALPLPYLYPTAEGGVQAEWSINQWEISLEIDLLQRRAQYQAVFVPDQRTQESDFNLADQAEWVRLSQALGAILALQA